MIEYVYQVLAKIGYTHPLHPAITHLVMGLVMGAFLFGLVAMLFKRESLVRTARHCLVLALIALPPTALLGYMDWQHRFAGAWIFPIIIKLILAGVLLVLLAIAIGLSLRSETWSRDILITHVLCLLVVISLGYFGGELVYGKRAPTGETPEGRGHEGAVVFNQSCAVCHHADQSEYKIGPGLKGLFQLDKLPVSGRPVTEANVRTQLKTPFRNMPPFGELPEEKLEALIAYLKTL
jgi:uncharacterized membrane protein